MTERAMGNDDSRLRATAYRGPILHALDAEQAEYFPDGGLLVNTQGMIEACRPWRELEQFDALAGYEICVLPPASLLIPGLIDLHVHLPQLDAAGLQAENLLAWLETHIFPVEARFADPDYARDVSQRFFSELLSNGTTTAAVFLTTHDEATRIAFEAAEVLGNRVIMGQNLMDANGPADLVKPAAQMLAETEAHSRRWHGADDGRIQYAWVPRFALSCSEPLLTGLGELRRRYPDVYLHTHLSEQPSEIEAVRQAFPWAEDYTGVYERFGLLGPKTILAHGIHLSDSELTRIHQSDSALAHCPGSNFFLKSGRFRLLEILRRGIRFGLGSDVGAGPELSIFKAMKDAQYMQPDWLVPLSTLFYSATLGAARALMMENRIGNFLPGKEADFLVLNLQVRPGLNVPFPPVQPEDWLSPLVYQGDDRLVAATFVRGRVRYGESFLAEPAASPA